MFWRTLPFRRFLPQLVTFGERISQLCRASVDSGEHNATSVGLFGVVLNLLQRLIPRHRVDHSRSHVALC